VPHPDVLAGALEDQHDIGRRSCLFQHSALAGCRQGLGAHVFPAVDRFLVQHLAELFRDQIGL